ncbi:MAG: hypothetical protein MJB14_12450 [Spirochaetes bacterium]|nr:hypothetical protein [Spirochaetota bacterium]
MDTKENNEASVLGALIHGYAQACLNLNIVAGRKVTDFMANIEVNQFYPLSQWADLERIVVQSYQNSDPIMLRVGIEMMNAWYHYGPGKELIKNGVDFLHFQTGSGGYDSVVKGTDDLIGKFELKNINLEEGLATVYSTTPFNRKMECGVLIGGMLSPGDLDYVDIVNESDPDHLEIEFH